MSEGPYVDWCIHCFWCKGWCGPQSYLSLGYVGHYCPDRSVVVVGECKVCTGCQVGLLCSWAVTALSGVQSSQLLEQKSWGLGVEQTLFPLNAYFASKEGSDEVMKLGIHRGLICCLYRQLKLSSDVAQICILSPAMVIPVHPSPSGWCEVDRSGAFLKLGLRFRVLWVQEFKWLHCCQKSGLLLWCWLS